MISDRGGRSSETGNPPSEGKPSVAANDQMHIMQYLMELQRDMSSLVGKVERQTGEIESLRNELKEGTQDAKAIRVDLAYVKGKVDTMPTTLQLLLFVIAVLTIAGASKYFAP